MPPALDYIMPSYPTSRHETFFFRFHDDLRIAKSSEDDQIIEDVVNKYYAAIGDAADEYQRLCDEYAVLNIPSASFQGLSRIYKHARKFRSMVMRALEDIRPFVDPDVFPPLEEPPPPAPRRSTSTPVVASSVNTRLTAPTPPAGDRPLSPPNEVPHLDLLSTPAPTGRRRSSGSSTA